ncbi:MAG TPA: SIP domain-containing protein, partial [Paenirhodobacter sp.]
IVLADVADAGAEIPLPTGPNTQIRWFHRDGTTDAIRDSLAGLDLPKGDLHGWIACESTTAKQLRQALIDDCGADPKALRASAYWRLGDAGAHENLDE